MHSATTAAYSIIAQQDAHNAAIGVTEEGLKNLVLHPRTIIFVVEFATGGG
jgi:hypothetical protein